MKLGKFEFKVRHPRVWLGLTVAIVVVGGGWLVWQIYFVQSVDPRPHTPAGPSVAQQKLRPSSYQHTRDLFGPWELAAPGSTGAPHLVMLHANNGVDVSSRTVQVTDDWQKASAIEIVTVVPGQSTVRLRTSDSNIFTVQYEQAFILAQRPDVIYAFRRNGRRKAQLVSTTVAALKR